MRGRRNVWGSTAVAVLTLAATALGAAMPASAQAAAKTVTIKVVGISRAGKTVAVSSTVTPLRGNSIPSTGPTYHLKPATYYISGDVPTPTSDPTVVNQTLVVRKVDVHTGGTITLDSRGGKLVSVWINGKNVNTDPTESIQAEACVGFGQVSADLNGPVYVKPTRIPGLSFVWAWHSSPAAATHYDVSTLTKNSIPAHPVFRLRTSQLVKTVLQVRAGTVPGTTGDVGSESFLNPLCSLNGYGQVVKVPSSITVYRSQAQWATVLTSQCSFDNVPTDERTGHQATVVLSGAARGPYTAVPFIRDHKLSYDSQYQFVAPAFQSFDTCFKSTVTLAAAATSSPEAKGGNFHLFTATVHPGRWYVLTTRRRAGASRRRPERAAVSADHAGLAVQARQGRQRRGAGRR